LWTPCHWDYGSRGEDVLTGKRRSHTPAYRREAAPQVCGYRNKANYERHIVLHIRAKQAA